MLTPSQQKALRFNRHLVVTANAGSGKTTVLVQRFLDILLQTDTRVNQIAAITFTEKAAGELRSRIAGAIAKNIEDVSHLLAAGRSGSGAEHSATLRRLEQIRDQLASANIGTIHSFCAQLLRGYPVEAGVDAAFTVLEGIDKEFLIGESLRETVEAVLVSDQTTELREEVRHALRMLGKSNLEKYLALFFQKREEIERLISNGVLSSDDVLNRWNSEVESWLTFQLESDTWRESLYRIIAVSKGKPVRRVNEMLQEWTSALLPAKKISLFKEIIAETLTKDGTLRKNFVGSKTDSSLYAADEAALRKFYSSVNDILRAYTDSLSVSANQTLLRLSRIMLNLYQKAIAVYEEKKYEQGKLDFEDLQLKALQLLRQEEIRVKLAASFAYIMVDEYQDTNRLQDEILRELVSNFQSGNLFIVGDPKQSIFGFRHAEVEIFEKTLTDLQEIAGDHVALAESFRPLVNIVDFVNRVFRTAMAEGRSQFDVDYNELIDGRAGPTEGKVEFLLVPEQPDAGNEGGESEIGEKDMVEEECELIARRLADLVESKFPIHVSQMENGAKVEISKPFDFRDAAILLRGRTHAGEIQRALEANRIPYVISSGIGYYQTQEVYDFFNYFKFLLDSGDDVALVGILRSPFFAVSDAELYEISLENKADNFWQKVLQYGARPYSRDSVKFALKVLKDNIHLANRIPMPQLVHRIIRQTGWQGAVAGLPFGHQRLANIEKLVRFAREFAQRGLTNLFDFVERLTILVERQEKEGQASIDTEENAVKVMTVHAAKGLEFPVVVVPFSHKRFQHDKELFIDSFRGFGFKVKAEDDLRKEIEPCFCRYLRKRSELRTEAEEKRILYVACTRARDMLVISGLKDASAKSTSYLKWIFDGLGLSPESVLPGQTILSGQDMKTLRQRGDTFLPETVHHKLPIHVITSKDQLSAGSAQTRSAGQFAKAEKLLLAPLKGQTRGEFFSATQIKTFLECPARFYLKYQLGLPEETSVPYDFDAEEEANDRILGELEGSLTHAALQHLVQPRITEKEITEQTRRLVTSTPAVDELHYMDVVDTIVRNVTGFKESEFGKRVLESPETLTEFSIRTAFGEDYLTGTIDRLYKNEHGLWCILDYKTDRVNKESAGQRAAIHKPQLLFYALLVQRLFAQASVMASLVFLRFPASPFHFTFSEADLRKFEKEVQKVIQRIQAGNFEGNLDMCPSCSYLSNGKCVMSPR